MVTRGFFLSLWWSSKGDPVPRLLGLSADSVMAQDAILITLNNPDESLPVSTIGADSRRLRHSTGTSVVGLSERIELNEATVF